MKVKFNINNYVFVKLNDLGLAVHKQDWEDIFEGDPNFPYDPPEVDEYGYSRFQMWELMEIFGPHTGLGSISPFDAEIYFEVKEIMSTLAEEYLELQGQLQQKLCALQTQADMLSKIKMTACQDAFDYDEACNTQTNESWLVIPPTRYLDPKVQKYYESQFWAYLWDFRGEQK